MNNAIETNNATIHVLALQAFTMPHFAALATDAYGYELVTIALFLIAVLNTIPAIYVLVSLSSIVAGRLKKSEQTKIGDY
ncbi:hypothetical protein HdyHp2_045 [Haloarcula virus Hardyhisp2]|uniref:Uncharacterized protein n=1 Tax=Haloarcula virus Hardyhisp2 TaxID=2811386 RepID=A0A898KBS7_9VIRU|nr:hypothetical protein QIT44_gp09 [Haloarcula virus Hardyhisp2]QSJ05029.1 hypothetical protein HdyHp2_045 [Haloarcula virus Hardyhisp2]